jgi:hypothetical protein
MSEETIETNDQLALIVGQSGTGKSAALRNIRDQSKWIYLNTEAGKRLPFKNNFMSVRVEDPYDIYAYFDEATANSEKVNGIIIDSTTFMMDMHETQYIVGAHDTQKGWQNYQQFFKRLLQEKVVRFKKPVLMTAHTLAVYNEATLSYDVAVPVKGALKNNGIEAYFSTVVAAKRIPIKDLKDYIPNNKLLHIEPEDEALGYKHVFQTRVTKATVGERIRSPMGMFTHEQTFMDNDAQLLLDHLHEFYEG